VCCFWLHTAAASHIRVHVTVAMSCLALLALVLASHSRGAVEAEQAFVVQRPMMQRQRRVFPMPRGQSLDIDFLPEAYDASFGTEPESSDAPEIQVGFNGADADGASWRQYVPVAVWSDQDWFDDAG